MLDINTATVAQLKQYVSDNGLSTKGTSKFRKADWQEMVALHMTLHSGAYTEDGLPVEVEEVEAPSCPVQHWQQSKVPMHPVTAKKVASEYSLLQGARQYNPRPKFTPVYDRYVSVKYNSSPKPTTKGRGVTHGHTNKHEHTAMMARRDALKGINNCAYHKELQTTTVTSKLVDTTAYKVSIPHPYLAPKQPTQRPLQLVTIKKTA